MASLHVDVTELCCFPHSWQTLPLDITFGLTNSSLEKAGCLSLPTSLLAGWLRFFMTLSECGGSDGPKQIPLSVIVFGQCVNLGVETRPRSDPDVTEMWLVWESQKP